MKHLLFICAFCATSFLSFGQTKQPIKKPSTAAKPVASKFGALAIDRSNGFYYGWSFDYTTRAEAEQKAVAECNAKGGNCTVVLSYSGTGCAAYRTVDGKVGTAFGWGLAKTKEEADAIAMKECLIRSNGNSAANYVFSCNSPNTGILKELYNASDEIEKPIKIANQIWSNKNLNTAAFRNGDPIPEAKSPTEWKQFCTDGKACFIYLNFDSRTQVKYGKLYNFHAVNDRRGLAPSGWHIPSKNEYLQLIDNLGGKELAYNSMRAKSGWRVINKKRDIGNGNNESGLSFVSGGMAYENEYDNSLSPSKIFMDTFVDAGWWTSTKDETSIGNGFVFKFYSQGITGVSASEYPTRGFSVRCIKD